ncbi:ATP-binding protein [Pseudoxanthomonas sp. CF125]|uniref:hybrid sensor histidine kinase/response regulator n=1 Tax=Pseudoxanthomonas sp. CF125 TaxID=1855303 RepID=UPI000B825BB6|nr:ATP-binding protein [Pseudoxanthomonas sp. CF125]
MRRCVWLLGLIMLCAAAQAAVPEIPRFRLLSSADGLPATTIPALARDRQGYLWIATWDGLARYDGVGFQIWRHDPEDPASLPGNLVQALHIDSDDRIWVATENGGLSVMGADRKGFRHYRMADHPEMGSDDVFTIASQGKELWFGTFGGGLHRLSPQGVITGFRADENSPDGLPSDTVLSLSFDQNGGLWIGTMNGLARFDGKAVHRVATPAGEDLIVYSVTRIGDTQWVGTSEGVFQWRADGRWQTPEWSPMFARPNAVMTILSDGSGEYWLASQGGLWRTEGNGAPSPVVHDDLGAGIGRVVQTALLQPDGGMWVPVPTKGLAYLRSDWRRIAAFSRAQGLAGGVYRGLSAAGADHIWLVSTIGKVERLNTRTGEITPLGLYEEQLKDIRLISALEDSKGRLWLGYRKGLMRIDLKTHEMRSWETDAAHDAHPDESTVDWLVEAPDGLWLSTQMGSVQRRDLYTGKVLDTIPVDADGSPQSDVEAMARAPDGAMWLAGAKGLRRWQSTQRRFVALPAFGEQRVFGFVFENPDRLWLHRLSGLEAWHRDASDGWTLARRVASADGLPALESTGLQIDAQKRVWLATRRGLFRFDPRTGQVRNYGARDGLLSQEFNDRALLITRDGVLAGSAADGSVMLLDTRLPDPAPVTPHLVLDALQVSRDDGVVALPVAGGFALQPGDHELQISARLLSFDDPLVNRYRSLLEGFDKDWVDQGASGERAFSTLSPGDYVLRMQAFDDAGNASAVRTLHFEVSPPWWRSKWGIASFVVLGLLLLGVAGALYRRRLRRRNAWQLAEHKRDLAEQASLAKTRFLATLGHEVRTPMTGVLGMSELLLATPLDQKQRGYTHAIQNAGTHLLRLVNDALDIARIEAGKLELQQQDFDVRALVDEVAGLTAPLAEQHGLSFSDEVSASVPAALQGDPMRVRQILLNLLGNAIKFTEKGGVTLRVSPCLPQGIRFAIGDTGPGISEEQQTRLFQRFEQAEGARTAARYGGSGLGLAICQELAVAMGGRISVESTPGQGTCFIVELPLATAAELPRQPRADPSAPLPSLRILLVEDDATVAEVIAGLLRARGHQVSHAAHGLAALTQTVAQAFDVALLDLDLPGLDGLALARQLRAQSFDAPLIAVTARADAEAEPLAQAAGFDGFLRKPVTGDLLATTIERAMLQPRNRV